MAAGLERYWTRWTAGFLLNMDLCKLTNLHTSSDGIWKPIKLVELSSAFFVLGIGYALAVLIFLLEKIVRTFSIFCKNQRNQVVEI